MIAGRMFQENKPTTEIARLLGVGKSAVSNWRKWWKAQGMPGLKAKPPRPSPARLGTAQKRQLPRLLDQGPQAHGFSQSLWTLALVGQLVYQRFGVRYGQTHIWRLMHALGFSCQKPQRRALQRDEKAITRWRQQVWPRLKKSPT